MDSDNLELVKLPDMDEVKQALFAIDSNKTPGPDGFGAGSFKHYWAVVKDDFFNVFSNSLHMIRSLNI